MDRYRGPEYARLFAKARKSLERTGGDLSRTVTIRDPDDAERRAVIGITGTHRDANAGQVSVRLGELDSYLRSGTGLGLTEVLEHIGPKLRDRPAEDAAKAGARADLLRVAEASPLSAAGWYRDWLASLEKGTLTRLLTRGEGHRIAQAVAVFEILEADRTGAMPLPALSDEATGNTKALANGMPLAKLVLRPLAARVGVDPPVSAEQHRALWDAFGVVLDDLASRVLVLNVPADGEGLGEWLRGAAGHGTPFQVTLHQLVTLPVAVRCPVVYVCENPAVLRRAAGELGPASAPLLCTEGLPSSAFHRLAQAVTAGGGELRYHGDFDWPGIAIADAVMRRHGAVPWRMSAADYRAGLRDHARPLEGRSRSAPWAPGLAAAMTEAGAAVNEEAVADGLLADLGARTSRT